MKAGWEMKTLEEVTNLITCGVAKRPDYVDVGIPFLSAKNVKNGQVVWNDHRYISEETHFALVKNNKPEIGDILYTRVGSYGEAAIIDQDIEFSIFVSLTLIKTKPILLNSFLKHFLNSPAVKQLAIDSISGSGVGNLNVGTVREFTIPLPPLPEQKRLVTLLDEAFESIATAKANAQQNLKNARALFESHLNEVFTKRGEGWEEKKLSELCDIKHGFAFKSEFFTIQGDYVLLTPGNFYESGGYRNRGEKQKYYSGDFPKSYILEKGDLLVAMTEQAAGLLGSSIIVPESNKFLHNQRLGLVIKKSSAPWINEFFFYLFNTQAVRKEIHDSASGLKVRHTSPIKIGEVFVSFPTSIAEQQSIVSKFEKIQKETQRLEAIYSRKIAALDELKKALLHRAFSGEL